MPRLFWTESYGVSAVVGNTRPARSASRPPTIVPIAPATTVTTPK